MQHSTILVTGAAGFIGSHVAQALVGHGWRVVGVDNFDDFYDRALKQANVDAVAAAAAGSRQAGFVLEEMDITDGPRIERLVATIKPQAIVHLAAKAGVRRSLEQPAAFTRVNVEGTVNLLEAARLGGTKRFILASSSSVYGNSAAVPFREEDAVAEPISPYAASKRAAELMCHVYWRLYRLPVFCLRLFTVYGPRQRPDLAIHRFTHRILQGEPIEVFGDGTTSRDYTYVDDIVSGLLRALERCDRYGIFNLGGSNPVTLDMLIDHLERAVGKRAIIQRRPAQPGDVERTCADLTRSRAELGYEPKTALAEGLRRFVAWFTTSPHVQRVR